MENPRPFGSELLTIGDQSLQQVHERRGFAETERVVYFRKALPS